MAQLFFYSLLFKNSMSRSIKTLSQGLNGHVTSDSLLFFPLTVKFGNLYDSRDITPL